MPSSSPSPFFCEFWVRFREIEASDPPGVKGNSPYIGWLPPGDPVSFRTTNDSGWYIWQPGQLEEQSPTQPSSPWIEHYGTTSIFYSTEIQGFLHVPYDCTIDQVPEKKASYIGDCWNRPSFTSPAVTNPDSYLQILGHALDRSQIEDCNINDSWDELLGVTSFFNGCQSRNLLPTCELAGRLSTILGLLAFATRASDVVAFVQESFRPNKHDTCYVPTWMTGRKRNAGLKNRRGIVVDIAFDSQKTASRQIKDWESGVYGPVLTSSPDYNLEAVESQYLSAKSAQPLVT